MFNILGSMSYFKDTHIQTHTHICATTFCFSTWNVQVFKCCHYTSQEKAGQSPKQYSTAHTSFRGYKLDWEGESGVCNKCCLSQSPLWVLGHCHITCNDTTNSHLSRAKDQCVKEASDFPGLLQFGVIMT